MKTILTFFLLVFVATSLSSQCNLAKDEIDDFTGKKVKESESVSIVKKFSPPNYVTVTLIQEGDKFYLQADYNGEAVIENTSVTEDDYIAFKLADKTVIKLQPIKEYNASKDKNRSMIAGKEILHVLPRYSATKENFESLGNSVIQSIRITVNGGEEKDFDVKSNALKKFQAAAKCFL